MNNKQMDIKQSDVVLILDVTDIHGEKLRVNDCATFEIRVFTNDPTHFLTFTRRDVISDDYNDKLPIDKKQLECLASGTICFDYSYSKWNADFSETDCQYNHVRTIVTQIYWRNVMNPENPCNVVNYETIQNIYKHLEDERVERLKGIRAVEDYVKNEYTNKLDTEIQRSNEVDIEFHKLIKTNKEDIDNLKNTVNNNADSVKDTTDTLTSDLSAEIDRSTKKDDALEAAINAEITRATNKETLIDTKLEGEIERSKTADGQIRDAVENERDRAITKENLINDTLTSEISRAKLVEGDITTALQALKTSYEEEKERSITADSDLRGSLDGTQYELATEITRSQRERQRIEDKINADKADLEAKIEDEKLRRGARDTELDSTLQDVQRQYATKLYVNDRIEGVIGTAPEALDTLGEIANVLSGNGDAITAINNVLTGKASKAELQAETDRAEAAEAANAQAITIINGGEEVIGSIAHGIADAKHYTDDEIAKISANQNITLANFATKNEVAEVDGKLTAHIAEADTKFGNIYTKSEVDTQFAKIWVGTQSEYDAITTKNSSTLYIIK